LITNVGPTRAISVTYLVPLFAVLWGALFLDEAVTLRMIIGGSVILAGTSLVAGMMPLPRILR
jgi:drug/metabolite transporter (DMT)-like permease